MAIAPERFAHLWMNRLVIDYSPNYAQLDLPIVDGLTDGTPKDGPSIERHARGAVPPIGMLDARPDCCSAFRRSTSRTRTTPC
jgi:hypothetical protein